LAKQVVLFAAPYPDTAVVRELQSRLELPVIGLDAYPKMLVGILTRASLILSGRFHCCIFAALAKTPFVPFRSNTDKIEGLVELLNYPVPVTVFEESNNEDVLDFVEGTWQKHSELSENLRHTVPQIVSAVRKGYQNVLKGQRI
jgi:polysaccharide pyruvyl transferase WcaK-like protein